MGGMPTLDLRSVRFYLPSAGGVLGYFVTVRPDVARIRKSVYLSWSNRQTGAPFWSPSGKQSCECRVQLTLHSYMTRETGLCRNKNAQCIAPYIRLENSRQLGTGKYSLL